MARGIEDDRKGPLFRAAIGKTKKLGPDAMSRTDVWYMVRRRAADAWRSRISCPHCETDICNTANPLFTGLSAMMQNLPVVKRAHGRDTVECHDRRSDDLGAMSTKIEEAVEFVKRNALYWAHYIRSAYLPYLDTFSEVALQWVAPALSDERISKAAKELESKVDASYPYTEDTDPAAAGEHAFEVALEYSSTVVGVRWAVLAMEAAALYHLVEQQVCDLCRLAFLGPQGESLNPGRSIGLLQALGIDVTTFISWSRIEELKHLANCVKHAEGNSCEQLRTLRPDLFKQPSFGPELRGPIRHVRNPLMGEDIYVTEQEFAGYVEVVRQFWLELANAMGDTTKDRL